jgi:GNAT superfamily N-acetyltransferase
VNTGCAECHAASRVTGAVPAEMIEVLRRAFEHDPHINWLIPQDAGRAAAMSALFRLLVCEMGGELHASADGKAVALWFPPGETPDWARQARFFLRYLAIAGPVRALKRGFDLKRMDQRHPVQPHFYLQLLGVEPDSRRRGLGGALLTRLLNRAQADGCAVYLETSNPENLAFYSRHGFSGTTETRLSDGLRLWSLLWQPTRPGST